MKIRWAVVLAVALVVLAGLIGAEYFYRQKALQEPLAQLLQQKQEILSYQVSEIEGQTLVQLHLGKVDDLAAFNAELEQELTALLGKDGYRLQITNADFPPENKTLNQVAMAMYEGERRGNYLEMSATVDSLLAAAGISDYTLTIDDKALYFQCRIQGEYYYQIVYRTTGEEALT